MDSKSFQTPNQRCSKAIVYWERIHKAACFSPEFKIFDNKLTHYKESSAENIKGIHSPNESLRKSYTGYIAPSPPQMTIENKCRGGPMVLNNAKLHLRDDLQKGLSIYFCLFHLFFSFPPLSFPLEQNVSPSPMEQLGGAALLSWNFLPSGYK